MPKFSIEHLAIWTNDLERLKDFYVKYFEASPGVKYVNPQKGFESYFLSFSSGPRLEIMTKPGILKANKTETIQELFGYAHLALSVGSEESVDKITAKMVTDGFVKVDGPRRTGDGYYESVILDPDGNRIEITV